MADYNQPRRPPREADVGFLIHVCRQAGLYAHELGSGRAALQDTRSKRTLFTGTIPDAVAFARQREKQTGAPAWFDRKTS